MKLDEWRKSKGLSQPDLAKQLGVTIKTVSSWENGNSIPGRDDMVKIHTLSEGQVEPNDFYALEEA